MYLRVEHPQLIRHGLSLGRVGVKVVEDRVAEGMADRAESVRRQVGSSEPTEVWSGQRGLESERVDDTELAVDDDPRGALLRALDLQG